MSYSNKKFELSPRLKLGVGRGYSQNRILKISAVFCLILALGLGINAVRLIFSGGKTDNQAKNANEAQVLGASDSQTSSDTQFVEYKVLKGDTLFNISQKFNINWTTLATLNNLKSPFSIKPGQILKIPK